MLCTSLEKFYKFSKYTTNAHLAAVQIHQHTRTRTRTHICIFNVQIYVCVRTRANISIIVVSIEYATTTIDQLNNLT